jgi:DeoR/GlpR family transcriptional regulator of sugar metabolism
MARTERVSTEAAPSLAQAQRHESIAEIVLREDFVSLKDLAARLDVSLMTIHRDLDELERQGVLRKVRGGATPQPSSLFESNVRYRLTQALPEKAALARAAVAMVEPGQSVMLDESTTGLMLARLLPECAPLTVITNSLIVVQELRSSSEIHLIVLGGDYWPRHDAFCGLACEAAAALRADLLFMSTTAISGGIAFQPDQDMAIAKRAMIAAAARRVLLVDHSKFGRVALHRLAPLSDFDLVITDDGIDDAALRQLRDAQIRYEIVARG